MAVLEDQPRDAEGRAGGQQAGEHADRGDERRLERDEQQQEAEGEHHADHERRGRGRARRLEVVVLGGRAADQRRRPAASVRSRSTVAPTRRVGRVGVGTAWTSARPSPPGCGGGDPGDARVGRRGRAGRLRVGRGRRRSGACRARRRRRPPGPARSPRARRRSGDDLDRGHRRCFRPRTGSASASRTSDGGEPEHERAGARAARPRRANRGERCSPVCTHGSASLSTRGPSLPSTAGSRVSVAATGRRRRRA